MPAKIYYDGECPFCTQYVTLLKLRETVGTVDLIDLRQDPSIRSGLEAEGFILDQGMVVDLDGRRVGGADATHLLATLSTQSGWFNRLNRALFAVPALSNMVYPVLRTGRWFTLFLMGRRTIHEDEKAIERQILFGSLFALFSLFHVLYYFLFNRVGFGDLDIYAIFAASLSVLLRPASPQRLFLLILVSTISTIVQAPLNSNHTMFRSMLLIGYWLSFFFAMVRGRPHSEIFDNFTLSGRGALLVMYFFGIFHKINAQFLDPATSCAPALWDDMLPPMVWVQNNYMDYLAIYGTFIAEGIVALALVFQRTRYFGMIAGIAFHVLLSMSNFSAYIVFTTLAISAHVLFLDRPQIDRILASSDFAAIRTQAARWTSRVAFIALFGVAAFYMFLGQKNVASLCLLPMVFVVCWLIAKHGRHLRSDAQAYHSKTAYAVGIFVAALYFTNASFPYLGLKTAQTITMFSNLRTEGGINNHLIITGDPWPFDYQGDVATVTHLNGEAFERELGIVYYQLLAVLDDNPDYSLNYSLNGESFQSVSAAQRQEEIEELLHAPFVRKFFNFLPVKLDLTVGCQRFR